MINYQRFMSKHKKLSKDKYIEKYKIIKLDRKVNKVWMLLDYDESILECPIESAINGVMSEQYDITNASLLRNCFV